MNNFDSAGDETEIAGGNDIVQDAPDPRGGIMPENTSRESPVLADGEVEVNLRLEEIYYFRH